MLKLFTKTLAILLSVGMLAVNCGAVPRPNIVVRIAYRSANYTETEEQIHLGTGGLCRLTEIMLHSTASPGVSEDDWAELLNKSLAEGGRQIGVHALVGRKKTVQTMPYGNLTYHAGCGYLGREKSANRTAISLELCEPPTVVYDKVYRITGDYIPRAPENLAYVHDTLTNAVATMAYLCEIFGIDPSRILSHKEGYKRGVASNHIDPTHWLCLHDVNMDTIRDWVRRTLAGEDPAPMIGGFLGVGAPVQVVDEFEEHEDPARVVDEFLERGHPAQLDDEF
jgi:hypothetical protein